MSSLSTLGHLARWAVVSLVLFTGVHVQAADYTSGWSTTPQQARPVDDGLARVPLSGEEVRPSEPPRQTARPMESPPAVDPRRITSTASMAERRMMLDHDAMPLAQLQDLATRESNQSPRFAFVHLALGDRLIQQGEEASALHHWQTAAGVINPNAASDEAQRRLFRLDDLAPFRVGVLLPLSGKYATIGQNALNAMKKAISDHRDSPLVLVPMDTGNTATGGRVAAEALANQGVSAFVGPIFKDEVKAAVEVASRFRLPILPLNPNKELATGGQVYLSALDPALQAKVMARFAHYQEKPRAAVLAPDSEFGRLSADAFVQEFSRLGGQVTGVVHFPAGVQDLSPWIKSLRMAPTAGSPPRPPEALFLPTTVEQTRVILPQLTLISTSSDSDVVDLPLLLGTNLWNRNELMADNAALLIGAVFCDTSAQERHFFRQAFKKIFNDDPAAFAQLAYDGVAILAQLLRQQRLGGGEWERGFLRPEGFRGATGMVRFREDGSATHSYQIYQVGTEGVLPLPDIAEVNQEAIPVRVPPGKPASAFDNRSIYQPQNR
ncbi:MAG: penicillin-binding protein activator [Magnetococcales bacterium]|nr:penicillin-binding protein activator [Magnetococcales bacterium]NGZ26804.1 penicillin-binding protein activator [Magnetococcales bacterium]